MADGVIKEDMAAMAQAVQQVKDAGFLRQNDGHQKSQYVTNGPLRDDREYGEPSEPGTIKVTRISDNLSEVDVDRGHGVAATVQIDNNGVYRSDVTLKPVNAVMLPFFSPEEQNKIIKEAGDWLKNSQQREQEALSIQFAGPPEAQKELMKQVGVKTPQEYERLLMKDGDPFSHTNPARGLIVEETQVIQRHVDLSPDVEQRFFAAQHVQDQGALQSPGSGGAKPALPQRGGKTQ
jgi:hypothetical protein